MPVPEEHVAWWGSLVWLVALTGAAFLVAWVSGTRLRLTRAAYVAVLTLMTAAFSYAYLVWLGVDVGAVLTNHWAWGVVAGLVTGPVLAAAMRTQPVVQKVHGRARVLRALGWEGVVYGTAEGVLLTALPPFMAWQMVHSLGWTGTGGLVARWALPVLAGAVVTVVHHLGYWNYRNRILLPIGVGLSLLSVAFLVTASWIAPALGHVIAHGAAILHGAQMPPQRRPRAIEAVPTPTESFRRARHADPSEHGRYDDRAAPAA